MLLEVKGVVTLGEVWVGMGVKRTFWAIGNAVCLDLGGGYMELNR